MEVSKSTTVSTTMSVILTTDDIREIIRNKFNLSSHTSPIVDYTNTINNQVKITWSEYSTTTN